MKPHRILMKPHRNHMKPYRNHMELDKKTQKLHEIIWNRLEATRNHIETTWNQIETAWNHIGTKWNHMTPHWNLAKPAKRSQRRGHEPFNCPRECIVPLLHGRTCFPVITKTMTKTTCEKAITVHWTAIPKRIPKESLRTPENPYESLWESLKILKIIRWNPLELKACPRAPRMARRPRGAARRRESDETEDTVGSKKTVHPE